MVLEFLIQQWHLAGALAVAVILLVVHEARRGGPTISPQQLSKLVNEQQAKVIDLRDPADYRKGHIVGALNIPYAKVDERWDELEKLRDEPLILVCKLGQFSSAIGKKLLTKKFPKVYRLGGGIAEWQTAQLPLVKN
ncbi:MAG: Rhodanese-related sulfurtransferase [Verrucomicrobiaceae bacterium]|nr:Rhodanese-related sulfurtransferase [Verrucomicrobiaceae bacterium]